NATSACLDGIAASGIAPAVDVILGQAAPHRDTVAARLSASAQLHIEPDNIVALLTQADLAIGASGTSALERACLGLPTLALVAATNQEAVAKNFAAAGGAVSLGELDAGTTDRLASQLRQLSPDRLQAMTLAAAALCDGRGARRALLHLAPE